jgi:hypothetical protein
MKPLYPNSIHRGSCAYYPTVSGFAAVQRDTKSLEFEWASSGNAITGSDGSSINSGVQQRPITCKKSNKIGHNLHFINPAMSNAVL